MKKRLKTSKRRKGPLLVFVFFFIMAYVFYYVTNMSIKKYISNNDEIIVDLILDSSLGSINLANLEELRNPSFIVKNMLNQDLKEIKKVNEPIITPTPANKDITVYIYNTHPNESYNGESLEAFSVIPTVVTVDYMLKEYLASNGIYAQVEEKSVTNILRENNWRYGYSYKASRILLESAVKSNPNLSFFIDIHRDSAAYKTTITEINGLKYARVLFVIGEEYSTYKQNLALANNINDLMKAKYPDLTRGIITKSGIGVNGVYNQDFSPNCILIEVGGQDNTIEEINNTVNVLAQVLAQYLGGNNA